MNNWRLQNSTTRVLFKAYLASDHLSPATGKTIAVVLSKNGGAFGNPNAGASNATEISAGWYYFAPASADRDTLGPLVWRGTEGTIDPTETEELIVDPVRLGITALPNAAADAAGGLPISDAGGLDLDTLLGRLDAAVSSRVATSALPSNFSALSITAGGLVDITQGAADKVWGSAARTLTAFSTGLAVSVWDVLEASIATANSIGVKLKKFTFNAGNEVAANTESINDAPVQGDGTSGNLWRG